MNILLSKTEQDLLFLLAILTGRINQTPWLDRNSSLGWEAELFNRRIARAHFSAWAIISKPPASIKQKRHSIAVWLPKRLGSQDWDF